MACLSETDKHEAYRRMCRIRYFEEEGTKLFLAGAIPGAYHGSIGQEAAIVGACMALEDRDSMTGTHRSHGHPIGKGAALGPLMAELMGKSTGICGGRGGSMHLADNRVGIIGESAIVGGGIPLATGVGLSAKVLGLDRICLCFFGDGAVNQGTFHESLNMASLWRLPVIYFCENNGYAIITSIAASHGQPEIARRGAAYGVPGVVVDGQDVEAVFMATAEAAKRARQGGGPTLIEAKTYRFDEHNVGLLVPGEPYRTVTEVQEFKTNRDPLKVYRAFLRLEGISEAALLSIEAGVSQEMRDAVVFATESPYPEVESLYRNLFSEPDAASDASATPCSRTAH